MVIDDTSYKLSFDCVSFPPINQVGMEGTFLLDIGGNIYAVLNGINSGDKYGCIIKTYTDEVDDSIKLKVLDESGDFVVLSLSNKHNFQMLSPQQTNKRFLLQRLLL